MNHLPASDACRRSIRICTYVLADSECHATPIVPSISCERGHKIKRRSLCPDTRIHYTSSPAPQKTRSSCRSAGLARTRETP